MVENTMAEKWVDGFTEGMSKYIAKTKGETDEEVSSEASRIKRIWLENKEALDETSREWRKNLIDKMEHALEKLKKEEREELRKLEKEKERVAQRKLKEFK